MWFFTLAVYALLLAFPIAEVLLHPGVTVSKLGVHPFILVLVGMFFSLVVRIFVNKKIWSKIGWVSLFIIAPVITMVCFGLRYVEVHTHPNFIFSTFHIDLTMAEQLALYIILLALPFVHKEYSKKLLPFTVIALSTFLYHVLLLSWSQPDIYVQIKKEDGLIENATFFVYFFASIATLINAWFIQKLHFSKTNKRLILGLTILMAIGLLLIAGEEISWGQRIANIELSEQLERANTQGELNLHNNRMIFGLVYKAYFLLNLYGLVSWVGYWLLKNRVPDFWKVLLRLTTSRWYMGLFFLPNLVYVSLMPYYISSLDLQWEEVTEIYLAVGILVWMVLNTLYLKDTVNKK